MDPSSARSNLKSPKSIFQVLQPAPAWTAILAFTLFTLVCIVAGAGDRKSVV